MTALWWWIDRWRKSTAYTDMTLEEQGAYRNLLDEAQLRGGPLPNDERILAKACGDPLRWKRVRTAVMAHFVLAPDGWRNETLDEVMRESRRRAAKQQRYRDQRGNARGNEPRNERGNEAGNNREYPDPYPSPDNPPLENAVGSSAPARERVALPKDLVKQFVDARGGDRAKAIAFVEDFRKRVNAEWGEGGPHWNTPISVDGYSFWRARWREANATNGNPMNQSAFPPGTRTEDLVAALRRQR